ncbi:hypothetical protein AB0J21_26945 [Streptomyces sp. NPDC049954]|uniref:hypothetical protein n=1 Tax=Streptomyces sp. NPDC049954 TaxID=3155779 RepID=UPI003413B9B2
MDFKMSWAMIGEHMDEWSGTSYDQAAVVLKERVGSAVAASGMAPETQAHFRQTFLAPLRESVAAEGPSAVESGHCWSAAAGPLLVALSPAT